MSDAADLPDPRDAPRLPRVDSPPAKAVLEDVPSKDEIVEEAPSRDEVVEDQPGVDDLGGEDDSHAAWIADGGDIADGELTRDGTRFAATFGYGADARLGYGADARLGFLVVRGDPRTGVPGAPSPEDTVCAPPRLTSSSAA